MPSYRPPISRDTFHRLEAYYFNLLSYVDSDDYKALTTREKVNLLEEINYMNITLDIMSRLFSNKGASEKAVVAWEKDPDSEIQRIYRFSCMKVAALALSCIPSKVTAVCKGTRQSTGGYIFRYENDYEQDPNLKVGENEYKIKRE